MSSPPTQPSGGFSLFPNTSATKPPSRKTTPRPRAETPQGSSREPLNMSPPRAGRQTPQQDLSEYVIDGTPFVAAGNQPYINAVYDARVPSESQPSPVESRPIPDIPRTGTAFSEAQTLVRSNSTRSRSSIAKRPIIEESPSRTAQPALRSIFPQYNHELPFDRQNYFPTQTSPTHIPRQVISRQSYLPNNETRSPQPVVRSPVRSPQSTTSAQTQMRWPARHREPPVIPPVSSTDELRSLWKACNGWKAAASEGRPFCLKMTQEKDTPIYNLSSNTQTFYNMRLDPTSASAYVTLSRHDPSKSFKEKVHKSPSSGLNTASSPTGIFGAIREARDAEKENKNWQEALITTLEEESRRRPPHDGLLALLYPSAATKMALERPDDMTTVMTAERECARLVWDDDSANYFLVHPALATPFCITIERSPAWSRTEYTIEHIESPVHLAKLTRSGMGDGWMELDTGIASKIEAHYILDVAVAALMLIAHVDDKNRLGGSGGFGGFGSGAVDQFEPPPILEPPAALLRDGSNPRASSRMSRMTKREERKQGKKKRGRIEEFELDLESQASSLGKLDMKDKDMNKLPGPARMLVGLLTVTFKCLIWVLTMAFKALVAIVSGLSKCLNSEKL